MDRLPPEVIAEVVRQQQIMGWPDRVPAWAPIRGKDGVTRYERFENLTVADCEQLAEQFTRRARSALATYGKHCSARSLRMAGKAVLYARLYRCQYITLIGKKDSTEADMPFPLGSVADGQAD